MPHPTKQQTLVVKGRSLAISQDDEIVTGKGANILQANPRPGHAIEVGQLRSEAADTLSISDKNDIVELAFEDDLLLYTSIERLLEEIIPGTQRGTGTDEFTLPSRLFITNQQTRELDGLLIKTFKILDIKGILLDAAGKKGGEFAARKIAEKIEDHLVGPDILYKISPNSNDEKVDLIPVKKGEIQSSTPILLFIHGTASSTKGSFSELWNPTGNTGDTIWQDLRKAYHDNIFALEHRTLTNSPIDNVVDLMEKLPAGCRLHLVSHSRGGLLGELLCRAQFNNSREPFTEEDVALFDTKKTSFTQLLPETKKDYQHHQEQLIKLNNLLLEKQPVVERFVRVACPARGTTLASGKLDVYLSGILNVIGLIPALRTSPIYGLLKAFVLAVAKERTKPEQIPGLEAQMPGSPFIAMLNSTPESVKAHLAVIKGDIEPTGILKKISLFFLDRFYESDHDLVVNTPSMDGGAKRESQIPVLLDQGREINHFRYFENLTTRKGVFTGLTDTSLPPKGFQLEEQKAARIARTLPKGKKHDEVPSVFILPGLTGSYLEIDNDRIWVDFFDLIRGQFYELRFMTVDGRAQTVNTVTPEKPAAKMYGDLIDYLAKDNYVIPFAYDWRSSVLETSKKLGAAVDERLRNSKQPVRIVAHSMGGLVARAMMKQCSEVWDRMRSRKGSRVLMLGTPTRGSYSIARMLARQDKLIKMLAIADLHHNQNEILSFIRRFPGVLELLPVKENGELDFNDSIWDEFVEVLPKGWERPLKMDLKFSQKTWNELLKVVLDPDFVFYIAGQADETPISVEITGEDATNREILFRCTDKGDGRVPWETGIPKGIKHWFVKAEHGDIADHRPAFKAFTEIIETGSTNLLAEQAPVTRGVTEGGVMLPDTVDVFPNEESLFAAGMGKKILGKWDDKPAIPPLDVRIVHENLCFAKSVLAVGHYQGDTIVSAEAVLDRLLDNRLSQRLAKGIYPGPLLTSEILFNKRAEQFPGAIIIGLGQVGEITPGGLTASFRDAVIHYVLAGMDANHFKGKPIALSSLLIGTGANELSVRDSIASLLRGVLQANHKLAGNTNNFDSIVTQFDIFELNEDIAIAAQYALNEASENVEFRNSIVHKKTIQKGCGGRTRAYFSEEEDWWQRLRIEGTEEGGLKYTSLAAQARADMRIMAVQRQSIEPFLRELTTQTSASNNAGRVLFELLVPHELKSHAGENQRLILVVDKESASYPWELLEYGGHQGNEALAIKSGMIRQLTTQNFISSNICTDPHALVVGDPYSGKDSPFPALPGARKEARRVEKILTKNRVTVDELLINESGSKILTKLMTGRYGIIHLAGHGVVDYLRPGASVDSDCRDGKLRKNELVTGMVIGENQFLTPIEIRQMPNTPAFVFINCCHLGKIEKEHEQQYERRYHLAANLAVQLIEQGVKAVIAAGWAVDDEAALTFAERFYELFIDGISFGDATREARSTTHNRHPAANTWGAYQCYGDPGFRLSTDFTKKYPDSKIKPFVSLSEYVVAVKNIAQDATTASYKRAADLSDKLEKIIKLTPEKYESDAHLLSAIGEAWGELDEFQKAIDAYDNALKAQKAYAHIRCAEQLANLKCRRAVVLSREGERILARDLTDEAVDLLKSLNERFGKSVERLSLLGGSYKRRAEIDVTNMVMLQKYLSEMHRYYLAAYQKNLELTGKIYSYPLINALTARWLLYLAGVKGYNLDGFDTLISAAKEANIVPEVNQEHFWQAIAVNDCNLLSLLRYNKLDKEQVRKIAHKYQEISNVASSARQMRSVEEHVRFLCTLTAELKEKQTQYLQELSNLLRGLH